MSNLNILTDPVLSNKCSPTQLIGTERFVPPAVTLDDLPSIDIVLISHDHYDHLDYNTIVNLRKTQPDIKYYVPKGTKEFMVNRGGVLGENVTEMEWWEETSFGANKIVCTY